MPVNRTRIERTSPSFCPLRTIVYRPVYPESGSQESRTEVGVTSLTRSCGTTGVGEAEGDEERDGDGDGEADAGGEEEGDGVGVGSIPSVSIRNWLSATFQWFDK